MFKRRVVQLAATTAVMSIAIAACSSSGTAPSGNKSASTAATSASTGAKRVSIAFSLTQTAIPFFTSMQCGAKQAAKQFNVDLNWFGPPSWDVPTQTTEIQAAEQLHPQGWVIAAGDPKAFDSMIQGWMSRKIPVVAVDTVLAQPVALQQIASNNYAGGVAAASAMLQLTGGKGTYVDVGMSPGLITTDERSRGFVETMKKAGAKVLPILYPGTDSTKAAQMVSAVIQSTPDLAGVYVTHSAAAQGAASAILAAHDKGKIKLVGFDADPQQIRDLKAGTYDALIAQLPYQEGFQSVKLVAEAIRGQVNWASVPKSKPTGFKALTRANVDQPSSAAFRYISTMSDCTKMAQAAASG